jgi:hypothetical protein
MNFTLEEITVNFDHIDRTRLLESWDWLIGKDKTPILMSCIGDLFFTDANENCYWLDVGGGILEQVSQSLEEFHLKLKDINQLDEWFLFSLIDRIKKSGLTLKENELYGYKVLPVLGGEYEPENFEGTDIEVHFELSGQIHRQIKDLPDGTKVEIKVKI